MNKTLVIKLGGRLLEENVLKPFTALLSDFIKKTQVRLCLVHGGGSIVDSWLSIHGLDTVKKQGIRCTPELHMPIVRGALAGFCNTQLSGMLLHHSLPAVGLTLSDAFTSSVELPQKYSSFGKVGEIKGNDNTLLNDLMNQKRVPVLSSIAHHPEKGWFNINADQAATAIASTVNADELWLLSDVDGVMDDNGKLISHISINKTGAVCLPEAVKGGMHAKLMSAAMLARTSSCQVFIGNGHCSATLNHLFDSFPFHEANVFRRRCGTHINCV